MESISMRLRFHWMLPKGGEGNVGVRESARADLQSRGEAGLPDLEQRTGFCRLAEDNGIDSVLMPFSPTEPDPTLLALALGTRTQKLGLIVAHRSGLTAPALFVQQINTLVTLLGGRVSINMVAGHSPIEQQLYGDYLSHDHRYQRTDEFLTICRGLWRHGGRIEPFEGDYYRTAGGRIQTPFGNGNGPEIFVAGHSDLARELAIRHRCCWLRVGDTPEAVREAVSPALERGVSIALRLAVITRPTRAEAIEASAAMMGESNLRARQDAYVRGSDSHSIRAVAELAARHEDGWLNSWLWAGAVPYHGPPSIALVGSPEEVADGLMAYREVGVTQFILHGWPKLEAMMQFCREVVPILRAREQAVQKVDQ
jgi:alkanesulfonate monooxygenase